MKKIKKLDIRMKIGLGVIAFLAVMLTVSLVGNNQRVDADVSESGISISLGFNEIMALLKTYMSGGNDTQVSEEVNLGANFNRFPNSTYFGIGTSSPFATLSVTTNAGDPAFAVGSTTGSYFVIANDGSVTMSQAATFSSTASVAGLFTMDAGQLKSYTNSTSTTVASLTLVEADLLNYDTILMGTINMSGTTLTLPATSTMTSMVPTAGDIQEVCIHNATSTAANITIAAGTGIILRSSSSTPADLVIQETDTGCLKFIRQTDTDVSVLLTTWSD